MNPRKRQNDVLKKVLGVLDTVTIRVNIELYLREPAISYYKRSLYTIYYIVNCCGDEDLQWTTLVVSQLNIGQCHLPRIDALRPRQS